MQALTIFDKANMYSEICAARLKTTAPCLSVRIAVAHTIILQYIVFKAERVRKFGLTP